MKQSVQRLLDRYYPMLPDGIRVKDGTMPFINWMLSSIDPPNALVLNVGAGPTPSPAFRRLRGRVARLIGVDPDPVVLTNQDLDEAYVNNGIDLPFPDNQFDAVYADWTVEHVDRPVAFLAEIRRVLKPGCSFWFRTTNLRHYVTLVSAHTPQWVHRLVANRARALPKDWHDPWPTRYRMNTPRRARQVLIEAGFEKVEFRMVESVPNYLNFSALLFRAGVAYERLVNRGERFAPFRLIMIGSAFKPHVANTSRTAPMTPSTSSFES
jgi:ubiquinone/menaquinone biosynthesis C-methylase UbiE